MNNFYNQNLKSNSRKLRTESVSKAEKYIWKALLSRKQTGLGFKRQGPFANFIVDFFSAEIGLIIEIDGNSHFNKGDYDFYRERKLKSLGFEIVRFKEGEVLNNLDKIHLELMHIIDCLQNK